MLKITQPRWKDEWKASALTCMYTEIYSNQVTTRHVKVFPDQLSNCFLQVTSLLKCMYTMSWFWITNQISTLLTTHVSLIDVKRPYSSLHWSCIEKWQITIIITNSFSPQDAFAHSTYFCSAHSQTHNHYSLQTRIKYSWFAMQLCAYEWQASRQLYWFE